MILNLKRFISLLLVLMLLIGIVPTVNAAELDSERTLPEETVSEASEQTEPTEPTELTESTDNSEPTDPTEPTEPTEAPYEDPGEDDMELLVEADNAIMLAASTTSNVLLFDQASPNYTTYLSSQISVTYKPNGTDSSKTAYIKNLGWHFARINGVSYPDDPIYCIEPCKNYAASTSGNYVDNDVTVDGSGSTRGSNVWYAMPESYREAIALVLLYSRQKWDSSYTVSNTSMANNPNVPLRIATQFLIYEIVTGLRDPDTFVRNSTNGYTSGDVFYNAGVSNVSGFASNYNSLVSSVQEAMKIPSFTSAESYNAPTITMTGTTTTVTDSNGVLSNFTFSNGNGASFSKSGNSLTITQTGTISQSTVFSASRYLPSAANSSFAIYYSSSSTYQTCVKLYSPSSGNLNAYFKLRAPDPGAISLTKTTEDGKNLSGWRFGIYSDSACTSLVSGPHTTDSSGKISVTGLLAGTYYVKELGHTDSSINALYTCASTNPQKVTVTSGGTAAVSFVNKLKTGSVSLTKTTEDGKNLSGWQFGIYSNSACTTLVSGPHTTDTSGKISVTGLTPGPYYVKEIGHTDSAINALYDCASANPQSVTVTAGSTAAVSFTNMLNTGGVKLVKETNTGKNLGGWKIGLYTDSACTSPVTGSPFTTGEDGTVTVTGLLPGALYAKELAGSDPYWECDTAVKTVTIAANQTATVTFSNTHNGRVKIIKSMPDGGSAAGWKFELYSADNKLVGTFTTGEDGTILTGYLLPGEYTIKEIIPEGSPYICEGSNPQTVTIEAGKTAEVTFTNRLKPGEISIQKVDTRGEPLAGAEFLLEWSADGSQWAPVTFTDSLDATEGTSTSEGLTDGKLTSGEDGLIRFTGLHPKSLYRLTETKAPEGYQLLTEPVHEGGIQVGNEYFVQLTVVNAPVFELPMTGSMGGRWQFCFQLAGGFALLGLLIYIALKKRR